MFIYYVAPNNQVIELECEKYYITGKDGISPAGFIRVYPTDKQIITICKILNDSCLENQEDLRFIQELYLFLKEFIDYLIQRKTFISLFKRRFHVFTDKAEAENFAKLNTIKDVLR